MNLVCPHRPPCPGCPDLGRTSYPPEVHQTVTALCAEHGIPMPTLELGSPTEFRVRARLAVRGRIGSPKVGLFEAGSHRIVHVPRCLIHAPPINEVAGALARSIRTTRTPPYSDAADEGLVRYCQIVVERESRRAQVVLVGNTEHPGELTPLAAELCRTASSRIHSVFLNGNPGRTNAILGPHWHHHTGPEAIQERLGGTNVFFPPQAFGQSNLALSERLVEAVRARIPKYRRVLELFAGSGAIGLGLLDRSSEVVFNESSSGGLAGLAMALDRLPDETRTRARVRPGDAARAKDAIEAADVVIADPPRKGLGRDVVAALRAHPPELLVVVACGLDAFVRESHALVEGGALCLGELLAFDLFPHTSHVELVGVFVRSG